MTKPVLIRIEKDDQTNKQYSLISRNDKKLPEKTFMTTDLK